jgi:hypothetical protein
LAYFAAAGSRMKDQPSPDGREQVCVLIVVVALWPVSSVLVMWFVISLAKCCCRAKLAVFRVLILVLRIFERKHSAWSLVVLAEIALNRTVPLFGHKANMHGRLNKCIVAQIGRYTRNEAEGDEHGTSQGSVESKGSST